eukprot:1158271-Pelagomonas_calceolata.AAC.16
MEEKSMTHTSPCKMQWKSRHFSIKNGMGGDGGEVNDAHISLQNAMEEEALLNQARYTLTVKTRS